MQGRTNSSYGRKSCKVKNFSGQFLILLLGFRKGSYFTRLKRDKSLNIHFVDGCWLDNYCRLQRCKYEEQRRGWKCP